MAIPRQGTVVLEQVAAQARAKGPAMTVEPGYISDKRALLIRLRRIEGQIRGLQRLVDKDRYCVDILTQVSAATKALEGVALLMLDQHLRHCLLHVSDPAEAQEKIAEASEAIHRLVRS